MNWLSLLAAISTTVLLRVAVNQYPYSGAGNPPCLVIMKLSATGWKLRIIFQLIYDTVPKGEMDHCDSSWRGTEICRYKNCSGNDLQYWGLDYPPLTAYHSWIMGAVSSNINPKWVALKISHGYESADHKMFMRLSVLLAEVLIYFTAMIMYLNHTIKSCKAKICTMKMQKVIVLGALLSQPALLLVDHGHFQYNSISLGLTLWAIVALVQDKDILGSIVFSLALNYKQMELYHSLPFFCYLLGKSKAKANPYLFIAKLGVAVIFTFCVCWSPFFISDGSTGVIQVLTRIFPFNRGIYEDKVASFWCSLSVFIKVRSLVPGGVLVTVSVAMTLLAALPSLWNLLHDPTPYKFLLSLVTSSLAFFLFSFHVHEKTILLVTLPMTLLTTHHPAVSVWFNLVATFSMYPLLTKDGLALPTWALVGFFMVVSSFIFIKRKDLHLTKVLFMIASWVALAVLCALSHCLYPPASLPDIFPVIISAYSCLLFSLTWIYCTYVQIFADNSYSIWTCSVSQCNVYQIVRSTRTLHINNKKEHHE